MQISTFTFIFYSFLVFRIRKVITNLVDSNQTAYVKCRYISKSMLLIGDVLEFTDDNSIGANLFMSIIYIFCY